MNGLVGLPPPFSALPPPFSALPPPIFDDAPKKHVFLDFDASKKPTFLANSSKKRKVKSQKKNTSHFSLFAALPPCRCEKSILAAFFDIPPFSTSSGLVARENSDQKKKKKKKKWAASVGDDLLPLQWISVLVAWFAILFFASHPSS